MTQSYVTQCPHCRTSFRVNPTQLAAAHGAVRCGACLHVFNAAQQLRESGALPAAPAPQPAPQVTRKPAPTPEKPAAPAPPPAAPAPSRAGNPAKSSDDTLWIHDDLDLDGLDLDEELAKLEAQEQEFSRQFLATEAAPQPAERLLRATSQEEPVVDESWTQALLRDTPEPAKASQPLRTEPATPPPAVAEKPAAAAAISRPALNLSAAAPKQEPLNTPGLTAEISDRRADHTFDTPPLSTLTGPPEVDDDDEGDIAPPGKLQRNEPALRDDNLFELDDEPLQLDWRPRQRKPWGRWLGWGLLNLLAAGALAGQYVAYNFEQLARQDHYRPWFEQLCPAIGCQLPSKVDISLIKSSNLVVRSHPQFSGALVVDAILYNRAPFTQPFPLLEMRFADINGQLLASRRFKPGEYLAGELAGQAQMPPQTPIHISMDILDPGAQAVNYSLSFHSPE